MLNKIFEILKMISLSKLTRIIVFSLFVICLTLGLLESLFLSPEDYIQSDAVRIMYVHVPAAWISLGIFSFIALLSLGIFIFKNKNFAIIAKSFAPSGLVFNLIALVTGSILGKPTWGTWWAWDPRITSMLVLFLFYILYIASWRLFENDKAAKISSLVAITGFVNVPVIKFSVDWWASLHQPSSVKILSETTIHSSMLTPLLLMTAAFALFSILIFLMNGYGLFVWSAFAFTLINFFALYIITNRQLIKENKKFALKFNHLEKIKYTQAYKQRTNQVLVSSNAAQKI